MGNPASRAQNRPKTALLACIGVVLVAVAGVLRITWKPTKPVDPAAAAERQAQQLIEKLTRLKQAVEANPKDPKPHADLAKLYLEINQPQKASFLLEDAVKLAPNNTENVMELANLYLAARHPERAQPLFQSVVDREPKNIPALQGLAVAYHQQGRFVDAMKAAAVARKIKPDDNSTIAIDAAAKFEYAMQYPDPELALADLTDAKDDMLKLVQVYPDRGPLRLQLGRALIQIRDYNRAIEHTAKAEELMPNSTDAAYYHARAYERVSKREDAIRILEKAFARKLSNPTLHDFYGQLIQQTPDPSAQEKALRAFETAVKAAPNVIGFRERYATSLIRAGRLQEAKDILEKTVLMEGNRSSLFQQLSVVYTRLGDKRRAKLAAENAQGVARNENQLKQFEGLSKQYPEDLRLKLVIADRYVELKQFRAADDLYQAILEKEPGNIRAKEGLLRLQKAKAEAGQ